MSWLLSFRAAAGRSLWGWPRASSEMFYCCGKIILSTCFTMLLEACLPALTALCSVCLVKWYALQDFFFFFLSKHIKTTMSKKKLCAVKRSLEKVCWEREKKKKSSIFCVFLSSEISDGGFKCAWSPLTRRALWESALLCSFKQEQHIFIYPWRAERLAWWKIRACI